MHFLTGERTAIFKINLVFGRGTCARFSGNSCVNRMQLYMASLSVVFLVELCLNSSLGQVIVVHLLSSRYFVPIIGVRRLVMRLHREDWNTQAWLTQWLLSQNLCHPCMPAELSHFFVLFLNFTMTDGLTIVQHLSIFFRVSLQWVNCTEELESQKGFCSNDTSRDYILWYLLSPAGTTSTWTKLQWRLNGSLARRQILLTIV